MIHLRENAAVVGVQLFIESVWAVMVAEFRTSGRFLVTFVVALTLIALIAVFGIWTSVGRIVAAAGRKRQTVKEPYDWSSSPEVEALKDALDCPEFSLFTRRDSAV